MVWRIGIKLSTYLDYLPSLADKDDDEKEVNDDEADDLFHISGPTILVWSFEIVDKPRISTLLSSISPPISSFPAMPPLECVPKGRPHLASHSGQDRKVSTYSLRKRK
mmetsp:Transcript_17768/g.24373  ORF Transcript_17768/g.24373 Transcript_17768/m.24373 type:complete len:108 (+) Transcript_17768:124-447(+)